MRPTANPESEQRAVEYFSWERSDVLRSVPLDAERILSLGCGAGVTERRLVERGASVLGIERDPVAAAKARENGLEVIEHDLDHLTAIPSDQTFDCLLFLDILEHLRQPEAVIEHFMPHLRSRGTVVVSIPNFRHHSVLWALIARGRVTYEDAGILDRTHIRLTTLRMVRSWFEAFDIDEQRHKHVMHRRRERYLSKALLGLADDFLASQVLVVGMRST